MKHILLLSTLFTFCFIGSKAQITVNSGDYPSVNDIVNVANDTLPSITIGAASSTAQVWDFTPLMIHTLDTHTYVNPNTTFFGSVFSTSNIADTIRGTVSYFNKSGSSLIVNGFAGDPFDSGSQFAIPFADPQTVINFPSTYGTTFNDLSYFQFSMDASQFNIPTVDSIRIRRHATITSDIDAHGTITIPGGGPFTVIRQYVVEYDLDSIFVYSNISGQWSLAPTLQGFLDENPVKDTVNTYNWIANGEMFPVASVEADVTGTIPESASFKVGYQVVGILTSVTQPTCPTDCDADATVTGVFGQPAYTYLWDSNAGNQTNATATGLCAGTYDVTITDQLNDTYVMTITITDPTPAALGGTTTQTSPTCGTCTDGDATANPTGGTAPFTYLWDNAAGNQTDQTATGLGIGNYDVTITDTCGNTVVITATVPVGIKSIVDNSSIKVYPNPTKGLLYIQAKENAINDIRVYNVIGEIVQGIINTSSTNNITLNLQSLSPGVYFIKIATSKGLITKKINLLN